MLGSIIASYAAIIINGGASKGGSNESQIDEAKILEYENNYNAKLNDALSKFPEFSMSETQEEGRGTR